MADRSRGRPGWLHVGPLESRLIRHWNPDTFPPAETLLAVLTLSALPQALAARLAAHLSGGIVIGPGAVPDLPGFEGLRGVPLPVQAGSWERTAGVYDPLRRRVGIGSASSPSISVCGHELGHAVDHMENRPSQAQWWSGLHARRCVHLPPPYRQDVGELFAESFACVLTRRVSRLIALIGDEPEAEGIYHWMAGRYGIG
ncbi:hypothetical protein [Streptosporangium sandarakinum]|uniref:hypothetical protein n=1 Tax=Streptosporangium sandarakinum TaxID=1260955 RepID=UPI003794A60F